MSNSSLSLLTEALNALELSQLEEDKEQAIALTEKAALSALKALAHEGFPDILATLSAMELSDDSDDSDDENIDLTDDEGIAPEEPSMEDMEEKDYESLNLRPAGKRKPDQASKDEDDDQPSDEEDDNDTDDVADELTESMDKNAKSLPKGVRPATNVGRGWRLVDEPGKGSPSYAALDALMETASPEQEAYASRQNKFRAVVLKRRSSF